VQYASDEEVQVLQEHLMIPSMSRPANPYDNASCESFMKTLKREEIYANDYVYLDHLRANIEAFIEQYYNHCRALGARLPIAGRVRAATQVHRNFRGRDHEFFQAWGGLSTRWCGYLARHRFNNKERLAGRPSDHRYR